MIELSNLHVHYGSSHVVQGLTVSAARGEVLGIFGRNGVGKTTVLKTIAGWLKPSDGSITLEGKQIDGRAPDQIARLGVGFVPEDRRIFPGLTVEENLTLGFMQAPGRSSARNREALASIYEQFPRLKERRQQAGTTLSGGEQQMLAMARAMIGEARVFLIDEPSEGLAPMIVADVYRIIREMKAKGCTIMLVEQNVRNALEVCDRFIAIERGRVVHSGSAGSAADTAQLLDVIAV